MKAILEAAPKRDLPAEVPLLPAQFDWLVKSSGMTRAELERIGYRRMPLTLGHSIETRG